MVLGGLRFAGLAGGCTSSAWNAPDTTGPHYFSPSPFFHLIHRRWIAGGHYARLISWARHMTAAGTTKTIDCVVTSGNRFPTRCTHDKCRGLNPATPRHHGENRDPRIERSPDCANRTPAHWQQQDVHQLLRRFRNWQPGRPHSPAEPNSWKSFPATRHRPEFRIPVFRCRRSTEWRRKRTSLTGSSDQLCHRDNHRKKEQGDEAVRPRVSTSSGLADCGLQVVECFSAVEVRLGIRLVPPGHRIADRLPYSCELLVRQHSRPLLQ